MKASVILTLPVLALAAATPAKVEARQVDNALDCLNRIRGLTDCIDPNDLIADPSAVFGLALCLPLRLVGAAVACLADLPIPVKE